MSDNYGHLMEKGWVTKEEFKQLEKEVGFTKFVTENGDEAFWGVALSDTRFVLANHPAEFGGCPPVIGMVGVCEKHRVMKTQETLALFRKTGPSYLKYLEETKNESTD